MAARTVRTVWHDRWLADGGRGPRSHASRALVSTGGLVGQHLHGWDTVEQCCTVRWRMYTDGGGGVINDDR
jgi:hypothetical protein